MIGNQREMTRRTTLSLAAVACTSLLNCGAARGQAQAVANGDLSLGDLPNVDLRRVRSDESLEVHYLEVVTPEVEAICAFYTDILGVKFGEADQSLGGARTAKMASGGTLGVRAPMHGGERPVVRPYVLVEDIRAAVAAAAKAGAEIAVPPMPIPNHGTCSIFYLGGVELGLWQKPG